MEDPAFDTGGKSTQFEELQRTHAVKNTKNGCDIRLNVPDGFIYDIDTVFIRYTSSDGSYQVISKKIPVSIIQNMMVYQGCPLPSLVAFLEENLECFCSNRLPPGFPQNYEVPSSLSAVPHSEDSTEIGGVQKRLRPLPKAYRVPLGNSSLSPNLRWSASKCNLSLCVTCEPAFRLACSRCQVSSVAVVKKDNHSRSSFVCQKCSATFDVSWLPVVDQDFIGFLGLKQCTFVCLEPSHFQVVCENCNAAYETAKIGVGERFSEKCYACQRLLTLSIESVEHISYRKKLTLKPGTELPERGTCRHYKKSYRWFRFPCCGSVFPCDICHDTESGHKHEMATRMVCGLCSKEQSIKPACDCGMALKKKATSFWEGGKGNRDKSSMSRKDSKKYSR